MAMTLPVLVQNYEKKANAARLKKFYSTMLNVIKMSEQDNGEMYTWDFPSQSYDKAINIFFQKYYLPYMSGYSECYSANCFSKFNYSWQLINGQSASGYALVNYIVTTNDGMFIYFLPNTPAGYIWMFVDINGYKRPNKIGRDVFVFDIYGFPDKRKNINYRLKFWGYYKPQYDDLFSTKDYGCNKNAAGYGGFNCGEVIMRNGWEIPSNYPW